MDMILQTANLCKNFRKQCAVSNVSLCVEKNTVFGLLGANGAGKSTVLKMIAGILKPSSGTIAFDGQPWTREVLGDIGAFIETPPVYGNLTAYENLKVKAILLGVKEERIREVLDIVGLADTGKKRAGQFSLGMRQRLGIALALLNEPKLLILDEPANGLDPAGILELRGLLRGFPARGITVLLSSHILSEVQQTADHIGILSEGVLKYSGKVNPGEDLETLFMETAKKSKGEGR